MKAAKLSAMIVMLGLLPAMPAHAGDTATAFEAGKSFTGAVDPAAAAKNGGNFTQGAKTFGIGDVGVMSRGRGGGVDLANPPEASLAGGATLEPSSALSTSGEGQWVAGSAVTRPVFTLDPITDPLLKAGNAIKNDPEAVAGSLDTTYSGCQTVTVVGTPTFEEKVCQESREEASASCNRTLNVEVTPASCAPGQTLTRVAITNASGYQGALGTSLGLVSVCRDDREVTFNFDYTGWCYAGYAKSTYSATLSVAPSAQIISRAPIDIWQGTASGGARTPLKDSPNLIGADYFRRGCFLSFEAGGCVDGQCNYGFRFVDEYNWDDGRYPDVDRTFTLSLPTPTMQSVSDRWEDGCGGMEGSPVCASTGETCSDGPACRVLDGVEVCRDCWKYRRDYTCLGSATTHNCQALRDRGCAQTDSRCLTTDAGGACASHEQTYRCEVSPGTSTSVTTCGNTLTCLDGNCFNAASAPNTDFALAAAHLNIMQAAGQDFDTVQLQIFEGLTLGCSKSFLSFSNCCGDSGWGNDLNLAQCNENEKLLVQQARENRCHQVGGFCADKTLFGTCVQTKINWCCFNSKLARLINEQGRPQIGKGWGTPEAPDCSGFTPEQLQGLDFAAMDLSEFYNDVMAKAKGMDIDQAQRNVTDRITNYYNTGSHSITADQAAPYDSSLAPPAGTRTGP